MAAACGFFNSGAGTGFVTAASGFCFLTFRCGLRLELSRVLIWLMRLIPWLEEWANDQWTRSVAAKRVEKEYSPRRDQPSRPLDGLSPMSGPQPLVPSSSTGIKHQGTTGHGPRLTNGNRRPDSLAAKTLVHTASGPPAGGAVVLLTLSLHLALSLDEAGVAAFAVGA